MKYILYAEPKPQSRPRFSRKYFAYEDSYIKNYKKSLKIQLLSLRPQKINGPVSMQIAFFFPKQKTDKSEFPIRNSYGDLDNLDKSTWDMANEILFEDDRMIVSRYGYKVFVSGLDKPRIEITLYEGFVKFHPELEII